MLLRVIRERRMAKDFRRSSSEPVIANQVCSGTCENLVTNLAKAKIDLMERRDTIAELKNRINILETNGARVCILCERRPRDIVFSVCGHCYSCSQCYFTAIQYAPVSAAGSILCAICRSTIHSGTFTRIFWG